MDTTKENIGKCRKAVEVQEKMPNCTLNGRICGVPYKVYYGGGNNFWALDTNRTEEWYIWLPRQDQLWEICKNISQNRYFDFVEFCNTDEEKYKLRYKKLITHYPTNQWDEWVYIMANSREQLLLEYIYKTCFNKTWNGNDWKLL